MLSIFEEAIPKSAFLVSAASCERSVVDVLEKTQLGNQSLDENEKQLSCVMKFGGSSVASAERMREVADLILSFPEERPVIVLSAMGKTTNRLLLAGEKAVSCGVTTFESRRDCDELGIDRFPGRIGTATEGDCHDEGVNVADKDYLYDAFEIGFITTDDFTNADIMEATYPALKQRLYNDWISDPAIPIVTGFLGKGWRSCAVTTLGRGGSDLTATTIGKALGLREIQVWKDVDGVLTCDPNIYPHAEPVPYLTFDEAAELAYFGAQVLHPQSMRPAREGDVPVRVKNSYNPKAPGTLITRNRDMTKAVLTSIVLKRNVTMLDIASTRMLGQFGFLAKHRSIISLIGNVQKSSLILEKAFRVLRTNGVNVQMISQGASKVNISLIVNDDEAEQCVRALHQAFFESNCSEMSVKS
ncbi:hypothetical protein F8388_010227 [Cannabis sativa]|uniref:aspartate kinase n=1 Tax=Cannabis sativa TaxID=3483 RepID=A0A7J6GSA0_CANSA|nr:hypothetical protein F8388_010227 [Cannabis sativa]